MSFKINGKSINDFVKEATTNCESITTLGGSMTISGGMTIVNGGSVAITRNGKRHVLRGNRIIKKDGTWYVDGKAVDWDELGGKYEEENVVSIEITGSVQMLRTTMGNVTVKGDVLDLHTASGDVQCGDVLNVSTGSGDVNCGNVGGSVSTGSGNVYRK